MPEIEPCIPEKMQKRGRRLCGLRGIDITPMFTNVYVMTQGSPGGAPETMSYYISRQGFRMFNFGYASAASVLMLIMTIIIAQTVVRRAFHSGKA